MGALLYTWFIGTEDGTCGNACCRMINLLSHIYLRKEISGYSSSILPCISGPRKTENYLLPRTLQLCNHLNDCFVLWMNIWRTMCIVVSQSICTVCVLWLTWAHLFHLLKNYHTGLGRLAQAVGITAISNFCLPLLKLHRLASSATNICSHCQKEYKVKDNVEKATIVAP